MRRASLRRAGLPPSWRALLWWVASFAWVPELGAQAPAEDLAALHTTPDCTVRLQGGRRISEAGDREHYATLTITAPWGGCQPLTARSPRTEPAPASPARPEDSQNAQWEDEEPPQLDEALELDEWSEEDLELQRLPDSASPLAKSSPDVGPAAQRPSIVHVITPRLAKAVADAALRAAGYHTLGTELRASKSRARWSAALPDLRLRAARGIDETARIDYAGNVVGDTRLTGRADVRLEAALTWRLSELLFSGREPTLTRIELTFLRQRQEVARTALQALFRWQRAQNALADPNALPEEHAAALLESIEAEVTLSVLTGGWFSAERVSGAPWMLARTADSPPSTPVGLARRRPAPAPARPKPSNPPKSVKSARGRPAPPAAPGANAPGEVPTVGVNEPRDAFRNEKQVE